MNLAKPPSNRDVTLYIGTERRLIYAVSAISSICLIAGNILFVLALPSFWPYLFFIGILAFYLMLSYLVGFSGKEFNYLGHISKVDRYLVQSKTASVDIYLPVCGENYWVIKNTWEHVRKLREVHIGELKVYVLDDGKSEDLQVLAEEFKFIYFTRENNWLKKAGNLRNAFAKTSGEFIVIFDADFCPRPDFLIHTIPHFQDKRVAIVQSPQFFDYESQNSLLAIGASGIQEFFYRLVQVNRSHHNGAICVGTNAVYRRSALEPFGGTALMPYSEDVHTGFMVQDAGFRIEYLPINLASGQCPDTWNSYFMQQYRWAMGSISLFFSLKFWKSSLNEKQRVCYLTGMLFYIATGLSVVFGPIPGLAILTLAPDKIFWWNLSFSIPSFLVSTAFMSYWMRQPFKIEILECRQVSYFAHLFALIDHLRGAAESWIPTGTARPSSRYKYAKVFFIVYASSIFLFTMGMTGFLVSTCQVEPHNFILVWLFSGFNFYVSLGPILGMLRVHPTNMTL